MANKAGLNQIGNPLIVHSKVLRLEIIPANEEIAKYLNCPMGELVYFIQRLRYTDKGLVSLENAYYLKSVIPYLSVRYVKSLSFNLFLNTIMYLFNVAMNTFRFIILPMKKLH